MKNTRKKPNKSNNKTKKNNIKKCMETFVENKIKYWTIDINKQIKKLDNKKLTKTEHKLVTELKKQRKDQINQLKKQYKLYNCNINCKDTLLEPGLSNQIPKSMRKELNDNKELIKIYNNQRKTIFNNKTNVLVDNFYENTPNKIKSQLIKEGAISQCIPM
jgi:hypothetical protein